jgi:hypothetical protein
VKQELTVSTKERDTLQNNIFRDILLAQGKASHLNVKFTEEDVPLSPLSLYFIDNDNEFDDLENEVERGGLSSSMLDKNNCKSLPFVIEEDEDDDSITVKADGFESTNYRFFNIEDGRENNVKTIHDYFKTEEDFIIINDDEVTVNDELGKLGIFHEFDETDMKIRHKSLKFAITDDNDSTGINEGDAFEVGMLTLNIEDKVETIEDDRVENIDVPMAIEDDKVVIKGEPITIEDAQVEIKGELTIEDYEDEIEGGPLTIQHDKVETIDIPISIKNDRYVLIEDDQAEIKDPIKIKDDRYVPIEDEEAEIKDPITIKDDLITKQLKIENYEDEIEGVPLTIEDEIEINEHLTMEDDQDDNDGPTIEDDPDFIKMDITPFTKHNNDSKTIDNLEKFNKSISPIPPPAAAPPSNSHKDIPNNENTDISSQDFLCYSPSCKARELSYYRCYSPGHRKSVDRVNCNEFSAGILGEPIYDNYGNLLQLQSTSLETTNENLDLIDLSSNLLTNILASTTEFTESTTFIKYEMNNETLEPSVPHMQWNRDNSSPNLVWNRKKSESVLEPRDLLLARGRMPFVKVHNLNEPDIKLFELSMESNSDNASKFVSGIESELISHPRDMLVAKGKLSYKMHENGNQPDILISDKLVGGIMPWKSHNLSLDIIWNNIVRNRKTSGLIDFLPENRNGNEPEINLLETFMYDNLSTNIDLNNEKCESILEPRDLLFARGKLAFDFLQEETQPYIQVSDSSVAHMQWNRDNLSPSIVWNRPPSQLISESPDQIIAKETNPNFDILNANDFQIKKGTPIDLDNLYSKGIILMEVYNGINNIQQPAINETFVLPETEEIRNILQDSEGIMSIHRPRDLLFAKGRFSSFSIENKIIDKVVLLEKVYDVLNRKSSLDKDVTDSSRFAEAERVAKEPLNPAEELLEPDYDYTSYVLSAIDETMTTGI